MRLVPMKLQPLHSQPHGGDVKSQTAGSFPIRPDNGQKSILSGRSDGLTITQQLIIVRLRYR